MRCFDEKKLLIATHNQGKLDEIKHLFQAFDLEIISAKHLNLAEPEETENTFVGNARIKAHAAAKTTDLPALADDSGLSIEALEGAPGVYSADWAETPTGRDFDMAMGRVWSSLQKRKTKAPYYATFSCTLVLAWPDGHDEIFEGSIPGQIIWPKRGTQGHGYDPIFQPDGYDITFAEMDRWKKNKMSHRSKAFEMLLAGCFS